MCIHMNLHEWWVPGPVGARIRRKTDTANNKGVGRETARRRRVWSSTDDRGSSGDGLRGWVRVIWILNIFTIRTGPVHQLPFGV